MGFFGGGGGAAPANMVGATSSAAGTAGLVPAPAAGDQDAVLFGDAAFKKYFYAPSVKVFTQSTSQYYFPPFCGRPEVTDSGGFINTAGAILCPQLIYGSATISNIVFVNHTANANTTLVLGVYQSDIATGWPLTKIAQATSINLGSTAAGTVVATAISAAVKGFYWLCVYNTSTTNAAIKGHGTDSSNPFVQMITGSDNINSVPRKRFFIKNSSISSNVLPATLASSDLDCQLSSSGANPTPTLIVTY